MKRINVTLINPSKVLSSYKSDELYQSWIDTCIAQGVWGEAGNYSIEVLDATAELEAQRLQKELVSKQTLDPLLSDAKNRSNHTGTQLSSSISDFNEAAQDAVGNALLDSPDINFNYPDVDNQITAELTNTGVVAGTYNAVTVNSKGRVTFGVNSGAVTRFAYNTTSNVVSSSNTYANVAELTTASLPIGFYRFTFVGRMQSGSTANGVGVRIVNTTATLSTVNVKWFIAQGANGTAMNFQYDQTANNTNITSASSQAANTTFAVYGEGTLRITSQGTLNIQTRAEVNGSSATLLTDSVLILELV
jgi:hypothetical protein